VPPDRRAVSNTLNTRGDRQHNHRANDRLVYSPYNGGIHLTRKRVPFAPFTGGGEMLVAAAVLTTHTAMWCGVGKYYVGQKP